MPPKQVITAFVGHYSIPQIGSGLDARDDSVRGLPVALKTQRTNSVVKSFYINWKAFGTSVLCGAFCLMESFNKTKFQGHPGAYKTPQRLKDEFRSAQRRKYITWSENLVKIAKYTVCPEIGAQYFTSGLYDRR